MNFSLPVRAELSQAPRSDSIEASTHCANQEAIEFEIIIYIPII
jgi:hypothetical protein